MLIKEINKHFAIIDPSTRTTPQLPRRNSFRKRLLLNKEYKCEYCGSINNLEAHHIEPAIYLKSPSGFPFRSPKSNNSISNGIFLCKKCHKKAHSS